MNVVVSLQIISVAIVLVKYVQFRPYSHLRPGYGGDHALRNNNVIVEVADVEKWQNMDNKSKIFV